MNKKYNWKEIQDIYNTGKTWRELRQIFGVNMATIAKAIERGDFVSRNKSDAGKITLRHSPRTHTQETKDKISKIRLKFLSENPNKVPYVLNHNSKKLSYAEQYFLDALTGSDFKHRHRILNYELDFAIPEKKINLEIDGSQHKLDKKIVAHDLKRNKNLQDLGWTIIRVYWPEFQKLNQIEKELRVKSIRELTPIECLSISVFRN